MKRPRNIRLLAGIGLVLVGLGLIALFLFQTPSREISRTELAGLIEQKQITEGRALPSPYAGIYRVEGTRKVNGKAEHFYVTTHLNESEIKALFDQSGIKIEIPGTGIRGQWINIVSTLIIGGLVVTLLV